MHDQTAIKTEGVEELLWQHPTVEVTVDDGYRGLAKRFPDQVHAPPRKPPKDAPAEQAAAYKQWRSLQRWIGRRQSYGEAHLAVAGLVADRAARR